MPPISQVEVELTRGHVDEDQVAHRDVIFGRRITGRDLFSLDTDPQSEIPTQRQDLIIRRAITKFGTLPLPVPLNTLLDLPRSDRRLLIEGYNRFSIESAGDRTSEMITSSKARMAFGFKLNGLTYDVATFGNGLTGRDDVAADMLDLKGLSRACYMVGKEIVQLSQSAGDHILDGPVELQKFEGLDGADIYLLIAASEAWNESFFRPREKVQGERGREDGLSAGVGDGVERGINPQHDSSET
jgi:hypothetical protein